MGCTGSHPAHELNLELPETSTHPSCVRQAQAQPPLPPPPAPAPSSGIPQPSTPVGRARRITRRSSNDDVLSNRLTKTLARPARVGVFSDISMGPCVPQSSKSRRATSTEYPRPDQRRIDHFLRRPTSAPHTPHLDTNPTQWRRSSIHWAVEDISGLVSKTKLHPTRCGGTSDIYEGIMRPEQKVAIRAFRCSDTSGLVSDEISRPEEIHRLLLQNTDRWTVAPHPRIVPCHGCAMIDYMSCIIRPWYSNGNIKNYLQRNTQCDRLGLVLQVADGIGYLHERGLVHGDIKPSKILINESGHAVLTDFGLAGLLDETHTGLTAANSSAQAIRYSSLERLQGDDADSKSDVYSFGCVSLEILTGKAPFHELTSPSAVATARIKGISPSHGHGPEFMEDHPLFNILNKCWNLDASQRPMMAEVVEELRKQVIKVY